MTQVNYKTRDINKERAQYNNVRNAGVTRKSVAYQGRERSLERQREVSRERDLAPVIVKKRVKASPFPVNFIFYTLIIMMMLMFIVYNNSVVNEISYDISATKSTLAEQELYNEELRIQLEKKYDLKEIERIATNELGLVKSSSITKHYVDISGGDKVVVSEDAAHQESGLGITLSSLKKSVAKLYENYVG